MRRIQLQTTERENTVEAKCEAGEIDIERLFRHARDRTYEHDVICAILEDDVVEVNGVAPFQVAKRRVDGRALHVFA